ncbi:hypothetical protein JHK86_045205 [Glycine max]|nr:hypothetical protein JHK86_045205 [Glycine max]
MSYCVYHSSRKPLALSQSRYVTKSLVSIKTPSNALPLRIFALDTSTQSQRSRPNNITPSPLPKNPQKPLLKLPISTTRISVHSSLSWLVTPLPQVLRALHIEGEPSFDLAKSLYILVAIYYSLGDESVSTEAEVFTLLKDYLKSHILLVYVDKEKPLLDEDIEVKHMKRLEQVRARHPYHAISEDQSELVKVFYTYARANLEGNLFSTVNGVDMVIDIVVWKEVAGLDMGGVRKFDETLDGYNEMQTYRGMLFDPTMNLRNRLEVGGLTTKDIILVYLITYILTSSHRLVDYEFPYVVLASRFIDYFNADVSNEIVDFTKASSEITERHFKKLGMRFIDHEWIMVGESPAGNFDQMQEDVEAKSSTRA